MATPRSESDDVAARLAQAADRLKAERAPGELPAAEPGGSPRSGASTISSGDEALTLLKTLCAELRDADLEVRRARIRIAELAAEAAARKAPPEAA
jgi:hypothetical protein